MLSMLECFELRRVAEVSSYWDTEVNFITNTSRETSGVMGPTLGKTLPCS